MKLNKKIISVLLILVVVFVLIILVNIQWLIDYAINYRWNQNYHQSWFVQALDDYEYVKNYAWFYNKSNALYKLWKYKSALTWYIGLMNISDDKQKSVLWYNAANTFYKLHENLPDNQKRSLLLQSIEWYKESLDLKYTENANKNLEFVLAKLEEFDKKQSEQNQEWGENGEDQQWEKWNQHEKWEEENIQTWANAANEEGEQDGNKSQSSIVLSDEQKQEIEEYAQELQENQKNYGQYYNKRYVENPWSPFDNSVLNWSEWDKDW